MNKILKIRKLAENVNEYVFDAPKVVKNAKPGQFIILRVDEVGERVPFTICDMDKKAGTLTILVQTIGLSTMKLAKLKEGEYISDLVGPLGKHTELEGFKNVVMVGGGIGTAVIYPQAKHLKTVNKPAQVIIGARNKSLIMYEEEFRNAASKLHITTDDGSYVQKGFVTDVLRKILTEDNTVDCVFAVGPMPMMRAVANLTKEFNVHTIVSMNSMMVDGTGMCGCCRLTVGGETKYACINGPEFDAHQIDWAESINRSKVFTEIEKQHICRLTGEVR